MTDKTGFHRNATDISILKADREWFSSAPGTVSSLSPQFSKQLEVAEKLQSTEAEPVWKAAIAEASCEIWGQKSDKG